MSRRLGASNAPHPATDASRRDWARLTLLAATLPALLLSVPALARYLCRNCGRSFSGIPGFKGRHTDPKTIVRVLREVVRGLSCASAQGMLADEGTAVHESTIYRDMIRN